ncbi:hypothetical protein PENSPDRAFT_744900 [Peniophora sp. CONT]|nr:hypothetical protein PENSPDRAFT_744900 [Peniophora sp. CONT]
MIASTSTSSVHKASLVDASTHSPALLELVEQPVTRPVIDYLIDVVEDTVDAALGRSATRGRTLKRAHSEQFATLVHNVLTRAEVELPVILTTLAYLDRARPHLHIALEEWANERVFLGALIVASKYTNDSSLKNIHWAMCTGIFGKRDIGRIEREFLSVLDWDLSISEDDALAHYAQLMPEVHLSALPPMSPLPLPSTTTATSSTVSSPMPALQHSPSSSLASLSPRTPPSYVEDPMEVDVAPSSRLHSREGSIDVPAPIAHKHLHSHSHSNSHSALKLLRSFHFPRHHHAHPHAAAA